jgi:hypothetical protein
MDITGKVISMALLGLLLFFVVKFIFPIAEAVTGFLQAFLGRMASFF